MENRGDLDIGFEHAKAALDIGQALVARDSFSGSEVRRVGDQCELAIEEFCLCDGVFVDRPAEPIRVEIGLEKTGHLGLCHGPGEAAVSPAIRGATPLGRLSVWPQILPRRICRCAVRAQTLRIQLADHLLGHGLSYAEPGS